MKSNEYGKSDHLEAMMVAFAKLLGAAPREARALAAALAKGPDRPSNERDALAKVRRAVLVSGTEDDADRAILGTWLARNDARINLEGLPVSGPAAGGLPMPPQDLDQSLLSGVVDVLGFAPRTHRARPLRSDT